MPDANKIIKRVAREKFVEHGLKQKGQSRLWYFDGDYYLILVEFQPSAHDKGTYLNVGIDFNWFPRSYFAFELGHRLSAFNEANDENDFEKDVRGLCDLAINKVAEYRDILHDKVVAANRLFSDSSGNGNEWGKFNAGVLYGLTGNFRKSVELLKDVTRAKGDLDWEIERATISKKYINAIEAGEFLRVYEEIVERTKKLKGIDQRVH